MENINNKQRFNIISSKNKEQERSKGVSGRFYSGNDNSQEVAFELKI